MLPEQFGYMLTLKKATHHYYTRQGNKLRTSKYNTYMVQCTIRSKGYPIFLEQNKY